MKNKISLLKDYFKDKPDVLFAFVFGSQAKKVAGKISDWDIAVYFKPKRLYLEWEETDARYPQEEELWNDLIGILATDNVDLVVLNRCPANIAASAIEKGIPLAVRDEGLLLDFMLVVTQQALDFRNFTENFYEVSQRSLSLSPEDKERLIRIISFLEQELGLFDYYEEFTFQDYRDDPHKRHDIERWIENILNSAIDIGQIALASEKKVIPQTYRDVFIDLEVLPAFRDKGFDKIADWVKLRNILAHEYLDIRWKRIEDFVKNSRKVLNVFLETTKGFIK